MVERNLDANAAEGTQSFNLRGFLEIGFRQRRVIINSFLGIFSVAVLLAFLLPKKYEAQMKILVRHERAESVVSPERESPVQWRTEVSEEELQSEAELIKSRDLLTKVVVACDLQNLGVSSLWNRTGDKDDQRISRAVVALEKNLTVQPIKLESDQRRLQIQRSTACSPRAELSSQPVSRKTSGHAPCSGRIRFFSSASRGIPKSPGKCRGQIDGFQPRTGSG